jgi:hypothetical protein
MYKFDVKSGEVVAVSCTKIIQDSHSGVPMKMCRKMAADKPGASSDQDSHYQVIQGSFGSVA